MTTAKYVQLGGNSFKINSLANRAISTFFTVIFFFALGAIVDSREASSKPLCPAGMTAAEFDMIVGGCSFRVTYCYSCMTTFPGEAELYEIRPLDSGYCRDLTSEVRDSASVKIAQHYTTVCDIEECPLTSKFANLHIKYKTCVTAENKEYSDSLGLYTALVYNPCGESYCNVSISICYEWVPHPTEPGIFIKQMVYQCGPVIRSGPLTGCGPKPIYLPLNPPPGYTWDDTWTTPCYLPFPISNLCPKPPFCEE